MSRVFAGFLESLLLAAVRVLGGAQPRWQGCGPLYETRIYLANHSSHLDFLLLAAALPEPLRKRTRPVAASEYWNASALRRYVILRIFRGVLLDRKGSELNPLEPAAVALRRGDSLIFFPEGTRGAGERLQPLKPGIFLLARDFPEVDIVPVWIDNSYRVLPKGFAIPVPLLCSMTFGAPVRWKAAQSQAEFMAEIREALEGLRPT